MTIELFALFKFKTVEGVDIHWKAVDFLHSRYSHNGKSADIEYDPSKEQAMLTFRNQSSLIAFKDLQDHLKILGIFNESPASERHSSSFAPLP